MDLCLNGESLNTSSKTIEHLIDEKKLDAEGVVVEVNLKILKKEEWATTALKSGDKIEFVTFVGGG